MNLFSLAIVLGLIAPALAVGVCAWLWHGALQHFWWFIGIGGVASYILMATCLTWALSDIGMTGKLSGMPTPALDPVAIRYLSFMLAWLAGSAAILFFTRYLLSKI